MLAIYARLSREEKNSQSIENQIDLGVQYAKDKELQYKVYIDEGVSGTLSTNERPFFETLMNDISEGIITRVWVSRQDRLERNPEVWYYAVRMFKNYNIKLVLDDKGDFDYNNVDKMFEGSLMSIINKKYVDTLSAASRRQILRNIEKGYVHGRPAYGFKKGDEKLMIIDEDEKKVIETIYEMSLKGIGTNSIAKILNEQNIQTSYQKIGEGTYFHKDQFGKKTVFNKADTKWSSNTVLNIIKNPLYKGERVWKGEIYYVDKIFEPDYWKLVNDNLKKNRNNSGKKVYHQYLLKGLLKCHKCDRNMTGKRRPDKSDNFYYCSSKRIYSGGCGNRSINIDAIEGIIWSLFFKEGKLLEFLKEELEKDDDIISLIYDDIKACENRKKQILRERTRLLSVIKAGDFGGEQFMVNELNTIKTKIEDENHKIADYELQISNSKNSQKLIENHNEDFKDYTNDLTFLEKQKIIQKYIYQVRIIYNDTKGNNMFNNTYSLVVKFKFKTDEEYFLFFRKSNLLFSINRESFIHSKFFNNKSEESYSEENVTSLMKKMYVFMPNIGLVNKPFTIKDKNVAIIPNTIIPFGDFASWDNESISKFYLRNPEFLNGDIGVSVPSFINDERYEKLKRNYTIFKETGGSLETWVKNICRMQNIKVIE